MHRSLRYPLQQHEDALLDFCKFGVNLVERAWWLIAEEDAVEVDFVSYLADATVFFIHGFVVDPRVRDKRLHFAQKERDNVLFQRHILIVTQGRIRFVLYYLALFVGFLLINAEDGVE